MNNEIIFDIIERLNNIQHMIEFCDKEVKKVCALGQELELSDKLLSSYKESLNAFANRTNIMMDQFL